METNQGVLARLKLIRDVEKIKNFRANQNFNEYQGWPRVLSISRGAEINNPINQVFRMRE